MPHAPDDKQPEPTEKRFSDTLKRMLATPPKPHQPEVNKQARTAKRAPEPDKSAKERK